MAPSTIAPPLAHRFMSFPSFPKRSPLAALVLETAGTAVAAGFATDTVDVLFPLALFAELNEGPEAEIVGDVLDDIIERADVEELEGLV